MGFLTGHFKFKTAIFFIKLFFLALAIDICLALIRLILGLLAREFF